MQETFNPNGFRQFLAGERTQSRLGWLLTENKLAANRLRLFRDALAEEEMLLMRRPLRTEKAYELFGLLLGALPPIAIFWRILGRFFLINWPFMLGSGLFVLLLSMSAICCFVGKRMGARMGRWLDNESDSSRTWQLIVSLGAGIVWGVITGAAGGLPAFGIGAIYGILCALPVGVLAFPLFTLLHRPLVRGGMIDARYFWPLASGVVMVITALILGL
jgi:hypothetical protein